MQRFITCRFLDVANTMLEITDFCPKLRFFSILITDFNSQRLAALDDGDYIDDGVVGDDSDDGGDDDDNDNDGYNDDDGCGGDDDNHNDGDGDNDGYDDVKC